MLANFGLRNDCRPNLVETIARHLKFECTITKEESVEKISAGPLTKGLQDLRAQAAGVPPSSTSPPSSPSSPHLFTQPEDGEGSFLFRTANDDDLVFTPWASGEVEGEDFVDVGEVQATPTNARSSSSRSPPMRPVDPPPPPPRPIASVVVRPSSTGNRPKPQTLRHFSYRRLPPPPLRDSPINARLRAIPSTSSSAPVCVECGKSDRRKPTIHCGKCGGHVQFPAPASKVIAKRPISPILAGGALSLSCHSPMKRRRRLSIASS